MGREKEGFRENLEILNIRFPDYDMLTVEEVMRVMNVKSRKTVLKHLGSYFEANRISKVYVAKFMCGGK